MSDIVIPSRNTIKRDTTDNWDKLTDFIPLLGEIICYTDYYTENGVNIPNIKIGDGQAYLVDLPFLYDGNETKLTEHIADNVVHISNEEREKWNNKLSCEMSGETLILDAK